MFLNAKAVKERTIEIAEEVHGKKCRIQPALVDQIDQLVEAIIREMVVQQKDLALTLRPTDWAENQLALAKSLRGEA